MALEAWINNNVKFYSYDNVFMFVSRICAEERNYNTFDYIDPANKKNATQVYDYLATMFDFKINKEQEEKLKSYIANLSDEDLIRIYYKRNMLEFMFDNENVNEILAGCFSTEFLDPNMASKFKRSETGEVLYDKKGNILLEKDPELDSNISKMYSLLDEFVTYKYLYEERAQVVGTMPRKTVMTCDTDSVFVRLTDFYQRFLDCFDVPVDMDSKIKKICIANIMTLMVSKYLRTTMDVFTSNYNIKADKDQARIVFKSEFLYDRLVLTSNKKHYAGSIIMQEGVIMKDVTIDMKGLKIKKSDTPKFTREYFTDLLTKDIILADKIDAIDIFKKYRSFEQLIRRETLDERLTRFTTPAKYNSIASYANPYSMQSVRGVITWNTLFPDKQINNFEKVNTMLLEIPDETHLSLVQDVEIREKLRTLLFDENSLIYGKDPIIALPKTLDTIPEVLVPLININNIIKLNVGAIKPIMKTVGFNCIEKLKTSSAVTNFIEI